MKGLKTILGIAASVAIVATATVSASASVGVSTEPCPRCKGGSVVYESISFWVDYTENARVCLHEDSEKQDYINALVEVWLYDCSDCFATWSGRIETGWVWECENEAPSIRKLFHPRYRLGK